MSYVVGKCPDCGLDLPEIASGCACGWSRPGAAGAKGRSARCTWSSGEISCRYPVGLFVAGSLTGRCAFHRAHESGPEATRHALESLNHTPEQYLERLKTLQRASIDADRTRETLRPRAPGPSFVDLLPPGLRSKFQNAKKPPEGGV